MKKRNQTAPRRLSTDDLRNVKGGLLPYHTQFELWYREVVRDRKRVTVRVYARQ